MEGLDHFPRRRRGQGAAEHLAAAPPALAEVDDEVAVAEVGGDGAVVVLQGEFAGFEVDALFPEAGGRHAEGGDLRIGEGDPGEFVEVVLLVERADEVVPQLGVVKLRPVAELLTAPGITDSVDVRVRGAVAVVGNDLTVLHRYPAPLQPEAFGADVAANGDEEVGESNSLPTGEGRRGRRRRSSRQL